jgi:histidinol-phosphate aminotransferase
VTPLVPRRDDLVALEGYHSPQVSADVRLNTNESPFPPPETWRDDLAGELERIDFHRYPDRQATRLRAALAERHGVGPEEVFCANGSNEVLQCLLLAYGGPGRRVALFEPTYALHSHIARLTGTAVVAGQRGEDFGVPAPALEQILSADPIVVFFCSPNNPTGTSEDPASVRRALAARGPLVVVDEAYGQFARFSALDLRGEGRGDEHRRLVVVRTFSKTWAMAAARLGYLVADPEVVESCEQVALPYHLSAFTQAAGLLALGYEREMQARVALVAEERGRLAAGLGELAVETWPSDANFILFRPKAVAAPTVWSRLLDRSVLVRDCSSWTGLEGCLRVTVGTPNENGRFLDALAAALEEPG